MRFLWEYCVKAAGPYIYNYIRQAVTRYFTILYSFFKIKSLLHTKYIFENLCKILCTKDEVISESEGEKALINVKHSVPLQLHDLRLKLYGIRNKNIHKKPNT